MANYFRLYKESTSILEYRFDVRHPCFFTPAIRSRIAKFILDRKRFLRGDVDDYAFGIDRLIDESVYIAAYPLHDVSIFNIIIFIVIFSL